jgi:hypothetical protein
LLLDRERNEDGMKDEDSTIEKKNEMYGGSDRLALIMVCVLDNDFTQPICSGPIAVQEALPGAGVVP